MNKTQRCENCLEDSKCYRRNFSAQVWSLLLHWNEVLPTAVDQPICEPCYQDLRGVLIDRSEEMERVLSSSEASSGMTSSDRKLAV